LTVLFRGPRNIARLLIVARTLARHGALAPFAERYRLELLARGYTAHSAVNESRQVACLSRWLEDRGQEARDVMRLEERRRRRHRGHRRRRNADVDHVEHAGVLDPGVHDLADLRAAERRRHRRTDCGAERVAAVGRQPRGDVDGQHGSPG